jgi:3-hydroxyacyl-[acyl-carrier-protein] dehydratase
MPGVLIVEALAQTAGIAISVMEENKNKLGVFTGIDGVKIRRQVVPGDTLRLEAEIKLFRRGMAVAAVKATVDGETAVEGEIKFMMVDIK